MATISHHFTWNGFLALLSKLKLLEFTIIGDKRAGQSLRYLESQGLDVDYGGKQRDYDLVLM